MLVDDVVVFEVELPNAFDVPEVRRIAGIEADLVVGDTSPECLFLHDSLHLLSPLIQWQVTPPHPPQWN